MSKPTAKALDRPRARQRQGLGNKHEQDVLASRWITGFERTGGRLQARYLDLSSGHLKTDFLNSFGHYLFLGPRKYTSRRLTLNLDAVRKVDAHEFVNLADLPSEIASSQSVYEAKDGSDRFLIPAQILVLALFGTTARMRDALVSPMGMEKVVLPGVKQSEWHLRDTRHKGLRALHKRNWEQRRIDWALAHPSPRRCLSSFYQCAASGFLAFELPEAVIDFALTGAKAANGTILVTRLTAVELRTKEPRVGSSRGELRTFRFRPKQYNKRVHIGRGKGAGTGKPAPIAPPKQRAELAGLVCVNEGLSDRQYVAIAPHMARAGHRRPLEQRTRRTLNAMLKKHGKPCFWPEATAGGGTAGGAWRLLRALVDSGEWTGFVRTLRDLETQESLSC